MKRLVINFSIILSVLLFSSPAFAVLRNGVWVNDMRSLFLNNRAVIMAVNIRTFNANDKNKNDIVEIEKGEMPGTFINAIQRLDELRDLGINTIHLLPVTPVGKVKAIGTAGSLYAISDFTKLNPQLDDKSNDLSVYDEAKLFVKECHKRNIRVIFDLPSCGSYDMFLANPNLFMTDSQGQPLVPADWTDVRVFKVQNADGSLNDDVYLLYKSYIDMVQKIGADGIRADVATSKPFKFWQNLISYAKRNDKEFMFLAEASENWNEPIAKGVPFTPYHQLLEAGFDGWYGSFFDFKDCDSVENFSKQLSLISNIRKDFVMKKQPKAVIGSFATHDVESPINTGGMPYSNMVIWLQSTLPLNSYYVDGFQTGDAYQYKYANQKASKTYTDDDYYYVHKGKIDIFNYSRKPGGPNTDLLADFKMGNKLKLMSSEIINRGDLSFLNTGNPNIFAYIIKYRYSMILVIINKDLVYQSAGKITLKDYDIDDMIVPLKNTSMPTFKKKNLILNMAPGESIVFLISKQDKSQNIQTKQNVNEKSPSKTPVHKK